MEPTYVGCYEVEICFSNNAAGMDGATEIFFAGANETAFDFEFFFLNGAVGEQKIFFVNGSFRELPGERTIRSRTFGKDDQPRSVLIQAMNDCQLCPARLTMAQPIVNSFSAIKTRRVRIYSRRLIDHQQM